MKNNETKFCKDCKYWEGIAPRDCYANCKCPKLNDKPKINLVTGKMYKNSYTYCSVQREFNCGEEGKYFERKKPLSKPKHRIKKWFCDEWFKYDNM